MISDPPAYYKASDGLDNRVWEYAKPIKTYDVFVILGDIPGWISETQIEVFMDLALCERPASIVQLGTGNGKALLAYAIVLRHNLKGKIYSVDPSLGCDSEESFLTVKKVAEKYSLQEQIEFLETKPGEAVPIEEIDILHVMGTDSLSYADLEKWGPLVKKGGWIVFEGPMLSGAARWLNSHFSPIAVFMDPLEWGVWIKR